REIRLRVVGRLRGHGVGHVKSPETKLGTLLLIAVRLRHAEECQEMRIRNCGPVSEVAFSLEHGYGSNAFPAINQVSFQALAHYQRA
ncbi:MAG: hypothetical protein Q8S16_13880, partial [Polaromonas sp.]|nr:hypothetical protein [Polaromonas sp.]